ncbi:hypothetical protein R3P38DRAFT_491521 [Favolaschia claudopus]|uniref:Uncharacterized protein n=1 Tax=Favolaschia claudopus TaxID=2862362 RepID=A0AAW0CNQ9_9AGAR
MSTPTQTAPQLPPTGTPIPGVPPILLRIANIPLLAFPINHTLALLASKPITASALATTKELSLTYLMGIDLLEKPVKPLLERVGGMVDYGFDIAEGIFVFPMQTTPDQVFEKFRPLDKLLTPLVNALYKIATLLLMIPPVPDTPEMYQIQRLFMIVKEIIVSIGQFLNKFAFLRGLAHFLAALTSLYTTAFEGINNTIQATARQLQTHIADASANVQKELDKAVAAWEKLIQGVAKWVSDWAGGLQDRLNAGNAAAEGGVPNPMQGLEIPKIPTPPILQNPLAGATAQGADSTGNGAGNSGGGGGGSGGLPNPLTQIENTVEDTASAVNKGLGSLTPPKLP